jgi:hypothetical protein
MHTQRQTTSKHMRHTAHGFKTFFNDLMKTESAENLKLVRRASTASEYVERDFRRLNTEHLTY